MNIYDSVLLTSNDYEQEGVKKGALGYIIEIYDDGYCEVEFSYSNGISYAQLVISPNDLSVNSNS